MVNEAVLGIMDWTKSWVKRWEDKLRTIKTLSSNNCTWNYPACCCSRRIYFSQPDLLKITNHFLHDGL